jgi:hypothetical protein
VPPVTVTIPAVKLAGASLSVNVSTVDPPAFTAVLSAPGARGGRPEEEEDEEDEDEDEEEEALLLAPTVTALLSAGVAIEAKLGRSVGMSMLSSMGTRTTVGSKK